MLTGCGLFLFFTFFPIAAIAHFSCVYRTSRALADLGWRHSPHSPPLNGTHTHTTRASCDLHRRPSAYVRFVDSGKELVGADGRARRWAAPRRRTYAPYCTGAGLRRK